METNTRDVTSSKRCLMMSHLQGQRRTCPNHPQRRPTPPSHSHQTPLHPNPSFQRSHLFNCRGITIPVQLLTLSRNGKGSISQVCTVKQQLFCMVSVACVMFTLGKPPLIAQLVVVCLLPCVVFCGRFEPLPGELPFMGSESNLGQLL